MSWEAWGDPPEPPEMVECEDCKGVGKLDDGACPTCDGEGEVEMPDYRFDDDVI